MPELTRVALAECMRVAVSQHGAITRAQAMAAGLSHAALYRMVKDGAWDRLRPGVFGVVKPSDAGALWRQRLAAASLWLGSESAVSHRASLLHWGLEGIDAAPLELSTTSHRRSNEPGLLIHRVVLLPPSDRTMHLGLQVTTVARTLVDVAPMITASALEQAYESARRRGLVANDQIEEVLARFGPRRPGRSALRRLLESAPTQATHSLLETLVWQLVREFGLPFPIRQFQIRDERGIPVARPDFVYPDARLVLEADGKRWHSLDPDWYRDHRRQALLTRLGWIVYRVAWKDVRERTSEVAAEIAELYAVGLARNAGIAETTVR